LVLHNIDPATGLVSVVVKTFFEQRVDLQITKDSNGYYKVELEDGEPAVNHYLRTLIKGNKPTYLFQHTKKGKAGLSLLTDDWVMMLNGYSSEFDLEQAVVGLKVTLDNNGTPNHEIKYGLEALPESS
jgi:hypothetical protein